MNTEAGPLDCLESFAFIETEFDLATSLDSCASFRFGFADSSGLGGGLSGIS